MIDFNKLTEKLGQDLSQVNDMTTQQNKVERLPGVYRGFVSKSISDFIDAATDRPPHEQVQLHEELALMRMLVVDVLKTYSKAKELEDKAQSKQERDNAETALIIAGQLLREAVKHVSDTAKACANIETQLRDNRLTPANFLYVVNQITNIAHEVMADTPDKAHEFAEKIKGETKLLVRDSTLEPTDLLPTTDDYVLEMDDTIPRKPDGPMRVVNE